MNHTPNITDTSPEPPALSTAAACQGLKIAVVTETYAPEVNGVAMTLGRIVNGLLARGHEVQLHRPRQTHEAGLPYAIKNTFSSGLQEHLYRGLPLPGYGELRFGTPAQSRLFQQWRKARPDIVHVVTEGPLGQSAVAAARKLHLPLSSSFHTNFQSYSQHYGVGLMHTAIDGYLRSLHNKTQATMVPTQAMLQALQARGYENLSVVSRGVAIELFSPVKRSSALRAEWRAQPDDLIVLYVGRLAKEKNVGLVITAFRAIQQRLPSAKLVWVGDGPLRKHLEQSCPQAVFAGVQQHEALAQHYASADVFLFPSVTETFGNVVPEALASGLAVVSFARAAALELISHGHNGVLAQQEDEAHFVAAALALVSDRAALQNMRLAAAGSVAHMRWNAVFDRFIHTLHGVLAEHRKKFYPVIGECLATPIRLTSA